MKAVLLVIDLQKDFFKRDVLRLAQTRLVENVNHLTTVARVHKVPVVWVRQEMKADMSDASLGDKKEGKPFVVAGSEGSKLLDGLIREAGDKEIIKTRYSPFFKTNIEPLLAELQVDTVIVAGINTHACIRMAAIDAYERDYKVVVATDCIASWDEEHHDVTLRYLSRKIATLMTNEEIEQTLRS